MIRSTSRLALALGAACLLAAPAGATTREIAELAEPSLMFDQSVLNQLTSGTYRDPYDELQNRPYNLLLVNIGRHSNVSPWPGQEGNYTRWVNALIGNNGAANVDNDADAMQGAMIRRETESFAWGVSASYLEGSLGSTDTIGTSSFDDADDLSGYDVRAAGAFQLGERTLLGAGVRLTQMGDELTDRSFEDGVGGFASEDSFEQTQIAVDGGLRQFLGQRSSWEVRIVGGTATAEQEESSEDLDGTGAVTGRFVSTNYDLSDVFLGIHGSYNRLPSGRLGETEYRLAVDTRRRELDNDDLSFSETGGVVTPLLTLAEQDAITGNRVRLSARTIFQAGQTEMFAGASAGYLMVTGSTTVDAAGTLVTEEIDDSLVAVDVTLGLRQPILKDRLRFFITGRADLLDGEQATIFDVASDREDQSLSSASYAIGLEGVLANVTFDIAWLSGEEEPVVPVPLGLPAGSRRSVTLDRLIFSAAVSW
jgi:hypothetical protein